MYLSKSTSVVVASQSQRKSPIFFSGFSRMLFFFLLAAFSFNTFAACQYVVTNQGSSWFGGAIRITNTGIAPINGWSVSWSYTGNNVISSSWNANLTGSNPYTATNASWNSTIAVGQTVEFGVQGSKNSGPAEIPVVSGSLCNDFVSSSSSSSSSSSVSSQSSSKNSSSLASSKLSSSRKSSVKSSSSSSKKSSVVSSSIKSSFSSVASSVQSSSSSANGCVPGMVAEGFVTGNVCNWYGTNYPLCNSTRTGWSYENGASCIGAYSCNLAKPYGLYLCPISSSSSSSVKSFSSISSSSIKSSAASSSIASSIKTSSSANSSSSSTAAEFTGIATHFDGLGMPYGGCGIPQYQLETQSFVALNVFNTPGNYNFYPRPLSGENLKHIGEFNNGKNCGRWIRVTVQEFCHGTNDGAQGQAFCRGGLGWVKDGLEGATQDVLVADSCGDANAWCRDSRYHLDFSLASMSLFSLNGAAVNLLPDHDNNRKISWHYIEAPNYSGDIKIYFIAGAEVWWPAISINNLQNGIHGVEQLVDGVWTAMPMNKDIGQSYILQPGSTTYQIRVRDVNGELINSGRVYNFGYPLNCNGTCTEAATQISYTIQ